MSGHQRGRSGTIPSMEIRHDKLEDNTIVIGRYSLIPPLQDLTSL